jgi:hypothetical protein
MSRLRETIEPPANLYKRSNLLLINHKIVILAILIIYVNYQFSLDEQS